MRLQEIMSTRVRTTSPETPADQAWEMMKELSIHHLLVLEKGRLLGLISERDLGGRRGLSVRKGLTVLDLMTPHTITAKPSTSIKQAANLMRGHGVGCLPVVEEGKIRGIITLSDLLDVLGRGIEKPQARTERAILSRRQGAHPKRRP